jgi:hypothetical protein
MRVIGVSPGALTGQLGTEVSPRARHVLLRELQEAGDGGALEAHAVVSQAAADARLDDPEAAARLLRELREAGGDPWAPPDCCGNCGRQSPGHRTSISKLRGR